MGCRVSTAEQRAAPAGWRAVCLFLISFYLNDHDPEDCRRFRSVYIHVECVKAIKLVDLAELVLLFIFS